MLLGISCGKRFDTLRAGLLQEHAYDLVYRYGLAAAGDGKTLVMTSTSGGLWSRGDSVDHWQTVSTSLPPAVAVRFGRSSCCAVTQHSLNAGMRSQALLLKNACHASGSFCPHCNTAQGARHAQSHRRWKPFVHRLDRPHGRAVNGPPGLDCRACAGRRHADAGHLALVALKP